LKNLDEYYRSVVFPEQDEYFEERRKHAFQKVLCKNPKLKEMMKIETKI